MKTPFDGPWPKDPDLLQGPKGDILLSTLSQSLLIENTKVVEKLADPSLAQLTSYNFNRLSARKEKCFQR